MLYKKIIATVAVLFILLVSSNVYHRCSSYRFCGYILTTDYSQVSSYFWQDSSFFGYTEITIATSGLASFLRVDSSGKETKMEFMLIEKELKDLISLFEKEKFFAERHRTSGTPIPDEANITITLKNSSGKVLHSVTQRDTQKTPSFKILNDAFTNDAFTKVVDTHK